MWSLDLNLIYTLPFSDINWQDWGCWGVESGKFGLYFAFISETAKEIETNYPGTFYSSAECDFFQHLTYLMSLVNLWKDLYASSCSRSHLIIWSWSCGALAWLDARCPLKLLYHSPSSGRQDSENMTKGSWVEIRTVRSLKQLPPWAKETWLGEMMLLYYQILVG